MTSRVSNKLKKKNTFQDFKKIYLQEQTIIRRNNFDLSLLIPLLYLFFTLTLVSLYFFLYKKQLLIVLGITIFSYFLLPIVKQYKKIHSIKDIIILPKLQTIYHCAQLTGAFTEYIKKIIKIASDVISKNKTI